MNEIVRVYYRVTSLRKERSETYYSTKGLLRPKTGLVFPKFHGNAVGNLIEQLVL